MGKGATEDSGSWSADMFALFFIRRVTSTPDPDTSEKCRGTPPISIAMLLQKHTLLRLLAESVIYTTPICITIRLPFVSQYFHRGIRVRGRCGYLRKSLLTPQITRNHPKPQIFPKIRRCPEIPQEFPLNSY